MSNLNLDEVNFQGVRCFRRYADKYYSAKFSGALINENSFLGINNLGKVSPIGHLGSVSAILYTKDGKYIITGGIDKTVKVWSAQAKQCVKTLILHKKLSVKYLNFIPERQLLISVGAKVKMNFLNSKNIIWTEGLGYGATTISVSPNNKEVMIGYDSGLITEFCLEKRDGIYSYYVGRNVIKMAYSQDGKYLFSCSENGSVYRDTIREYQNQKIIKKPSVNEEVDAASFFVLQNKMIMLVINSQKTTSKYRVLEISLKTGKILFTYKIGHAYSSKLAYNNKGDRFIISEDWNILEYICGKEEPFNTYYVGDHTTSLAYSPDDKKIVVGTATGGVKQFFVDKQESENISQGRGISVFDNSAIFSNKGDKFLTYLGGTKVYEWSISKQRFIDFYELKFVHRECYMKYSQDDQLAIICANSDNILEFDTKSSEKLNEYRHTHRILALSYNDNNKDIFIGGFAYLKKLRTETGKTGDNFFSKGLLEVNDIIFNYQEKKVIISAKGIGTVEINTEGKVLRKYSSENFAKLFLCYKKQQLIALSNDNKLIKWSLKDGSKIFEKTQHYRYDVLSVKSKKRLVFNEEYNQIECWEEKMIDPSFVIPYISDLFINECVFYNLHPKSNISDSSKKIMEQYGAKFKPNT